MSNNVESPIANIHLPKSKFGLGSDHGDMIVMLIKYFRIVAMVYFVWLIGYFNFSIAWILLAAFLYLLREKNNSARNLKGKMIQAIGINEKDAIMARIDEIPSWVYFPDKERAEWVNKILKICWPHAKIYIKKVIIDVVEPIINQYSTSLIGKIKFKELDLGDMPPRVGSIKVYTENVSNQEIMMDVELLYAGDANIKLEAQGILAGLKEIQFHGDARIILKPLCDRIPFFASMTFFLLKSPHIDFNLTEVANTFDMPGLRKLINTLINDTISKVLVLPNRLVIPILSDFNNNDLSLYRSVQPKGVFRIHVFKGINLKDADLGIIGKSDPYVKISGIGVTLKTKVINNNLNPVWNETFNIMIDELNQDPHLLIECYDKDETFNDDFLGGFDLDIGSVIKKGKEEGIYKLKNVKRGELNLKLEWFFISTDRNKLAEIRKLNSNQLHETTSLLLMDLKYATDLPAVKKSSGLSEPNPRVYFTLSDKSVISATQNRTTNPKWNENHYFFVENPETEVLVCKVKDEKNSETIAGCEIRLINILNENLLTIDRGFDLDCLQSNAGCSPKLYMKLSLKIFSVQKDEDKKDLLIGDSVPIDTNERSPTPTIEENSEQKPSKMPLGSRASLNSLVNDPIITPPNENQLTKRNTLTKKNSQSLLNVSEIKVSLSYRLEEGELIIIIHECRNLLMVHHTNLPDPYVKLEILPNDKKIKKKTKSIKDELNPVYNERFQFSLPYSEVKKKQLCLSVKNDKSFLSNETIFMGQAIIDLSQIDVNAIVSKWYELREKEDSKLFTNKLE